MSFPEAIRSALRQYVGFQGRARRSEYWWFWLFTVLVSLPGSALRVAAGTSNDALYLLGWALTLVSLALLLPSLAVAVRRLHDTGRSGWWILLGLIPLVGPIVLIVFYVQDSQAGANEHGPNPKDPTGLTQPATA